MQRIGILDKELFGYVHKEAIGREYIMTNHVSARVAWHMDGWNGHICRNPAANTYCVGPHSYPGTKIAEERILEWEQANSGRCCSELIISLLAFIASMLSDRNNSPLIRTPNVFSMTRHNGVNGTPPATVCMWPYEEMFLDE